MSINFFGKSKIYTIKQLLNRRYNMTVIDRINQLCAERGWTYYELTQRSDLSENTMYSWKNIASKIHPNG